MDKNNHLFIAVTVTQYDICLVNAENVSGRKSLFTKSNNFIDRRKERYYFENVCRCPFATVLNLNTHKLNMSQMRILSAGRLLKILDHRKTLPRF
jgi:hypothetical protein